MSQVIFCWAHSRAMWLLPVDASACSNEIVRCDSPEASSPDTTSVVPPGQSCVAPEHDQALALVQVAHRAGEQVVDRVDAARERGRALEREPGEHRALEVVEDPPHRGLDVLLGRHELRHPARLAREVGEQRDIDIVPHAEGEEAAPAILRSPSGRSRGSRAPP
jgi:hypothetical protein